ncbi:MAG: coiled-coil domain-containing protein, partial [Streptosporangiaceae bacterium]
APDQALAFFAGGDPQQVLGRSATIEYLARQRDAREQHLHQLTLAAQDAQHTAQAKVARLRQMIQTLAGQQQRVKHLLDRFHPESPVIGDSITPRMRGVRDEVDRRFGPFSAIGCYRPGSDGEHPLGRACDFMLSTGGVMPAASAIQKGYDIAAWAQANASRLGIMYIIYRQRIWDVRMASSGWVPMENRGSITANHYDHVHISVF